MYLAANCPYSIKRKMGEPKEKRRIKENAMIKVYKKKLRTVPKHCHVFSQRISR